MTTFARPLVDPDLRFDIPVRQWTFDVVTGRIRAQDHHGNLVMAIVTGPMFGPRLAAAFRSRET
ncbi:MAG: hypothetical protein EOP39_17200 [Rubrivivax sp.]|nr:MAG: hypothetical protein EOP39_17200 [Rubrivivax sp.]